MCTDILLFVQVLWLILRFFLLATELSVVIFGLAFGKIHMFYNSNSNSDSNQNCMETVITIPY